MSCFGKCGCGCCLDLEDMPYTSVSLISPVEDCGGGGGNPGGGVGAGVGEGEGDPEPPSASFSQGTCCFIADFNLSCQPYAEHCGLWASQHIEYGYAIDTYKPLASYRETSGAHECSCIKVQTERFDVDRTDKIYWVGRNKLVGLRVHVGKVNVTCTGQEQACKFYIAVTYIFETCDYALLWSGGVSQWPEFTSSRQCTGHYKDGSCSFTSSFSESSTVNNCTDLLAQDPWGFCNALDRIYISRIKLYDTLPTGQVTITNADLPPVSCCGGSTGCTVSGSPCGLSLVSNCVGNLPMYDGPPMDYFCQKATGPEPVNPPGSPPYPDNCEITIGCPTIKPKEEIQGGCEGYVFHEQSGCYRREFLGTQSYPGFDQLVCGYCDTDAGRIYYVVAAGVAFPCGQDLCLTGECCIDLTLQTTEPCQEFAFAGNSLCQVDIVDYTCQIDPVQTYETGAFCYNLPSVTIELT